MSPAPALSPQVSSVFGHLALILRLSPPRRPSTPPTSQLPGHPAPGPRSQPSVPLLPGNARLGDAATCRPDPVSTACLKGWGAAAEGGNPAPWGSDSLRPVFPGIPMDLFARAEPRLATAQPHCGPRGRSLDSGALIAPVVKRRKCTNTSSQDFKGGWGTRLY